MATYYVSTSTGNNVNNGTSPSTPWATLTYALSGSTAVTSGDTIYVAPGVYRENVVVALTSPTSNLKIIGSTDGSLFTTIPVGYVRITSASSDNGSFSGQTLTGTSKNYIWLENLLFEGSVQLLTSANMTFTNCSFYGPVYITSPSGLASNATVSKCIFVYQGVPTGQGYSLRIDGTGVSVASGNTIKSCIFYHYGGNSTAGFVLFTGNTGTLIYNCSFFGSSQRCIWTTAANSVEVYNSLFCGYFSTACLGANSSGQLISNYNRFIVSGTVASNTTVGANSITSSASIGVDFGSAYQFRLPPLQPTGSFASSPNIAVGTATGALAFDTFGKTWSGASPDAGGVTYAPIGTTSFYYPTERNASTITIAPGSTSQSIELYLGVTGLTASTSGLSAYYNRTRSADVQIPLVARTIGQAWTSGGFAEVNPNTMPGVYRLDIPNEALAAGVDDVTVVVRGASGTNGAVMSIKLSSGGLTTTQTASAVWGALTNDHTTHGTFGWNVLRADQDSKEGLVTLHQSGGISRVDADVHAIANDTAAATALKGALNHDGTGYVDSDVVRISTSTAAANELEGALLHNGTDYIDSNLIGGNSTQVFVGRFQLTQTGTTQGDIIEAFTTDTPSFELQLFDGDNNIVPVTGATLGLRILDVTSTVVETGTPTIEYGTGGIVRWTAPGSYVSIGCPAGMYRLFVDRTVSGTTTTFGPLQIKVQVQ